MTSGILLTGCVADILGIASTNSMSNVNSNLRAINNRVVEHGHTTAKGFVAVKDAINQQNATLKQIEKQYQEQNNLLKKQNEILTKRNEILSKQVAGGK